MSYEVYDYLLTCVSEAFLCTDSYLARLCCPCSDTNQFSETVGVR
jgi:hypothetical protein